MKDILAKKELVEEEEEAVAQERDELVERMVEALLLPPDKVREVLVANKVRGCARGGGADGGGSGMNKEPWRSWRGWQRLSRRMKEAMTTNMTSPEGRGREGREGEREGRTEGEENWQGVVPFISLAILHRSIPSRSFFPRQQSSRLG